MSYGMFHQAGKFSERLYRLRKLEEKALGLVQVTRHDDPRLERRMRRLFKIKSMCSRVKAEG
jgi:hypothetical protein